MSVHYKFKSALEYDTVTFDGLHISVKDLKNAIVQQKRIGKNTDFDLQVTNAQTKEIYDDDNVLIPKNTSLLIARIPTASQTKNKQWEGYGGDATPPTKLDEGGPIAKAVDLSSLDAPEGDKIKAMISQSTQDYDPSNYMKIRGANQVGIVPPNYRCYKCHQTGHWIKDCPLSKGPEPIEIKKSTGIPLSFMVPVDGPQVPGAMMTPNGSYAVPVLDHQTYSQKQVVAPVQELRPEIPEDLLCSLCSDLLIDAVMIPCCGNSFCDECIRSILLESEEHECPDCHEKDISPVTLIPNRFLRNSVANFRNTTGYVKKAGAFRGERAKVGEGGSKEMEEKTVISEADSTEPKVDDKAGDHPSVSEEKPETVKEPKPEDTIPKDEAPPGVSPLPPTRLPPTIPKLLDPPPIGRSPQYRQDAERPGTPTVDEQPGGGYALPNPAPTAHSNPSYPPTSTPSSTAQHIQTVGPPPGYHHPTPKYAPNAAPTSHPPNFRLPPPNVVAPAYYGPPPSSRGYHPQPGSIPPSMYNQGGYGGAPGGGGAPPRRGEAYSAPMDRRGVRGRTPPGVIDDPLAAFNRMLREKDERERRAKRRRSYSRSRSRSWSRSPPPRRVMRSRSRGRRGSRSRSRSISFSRSRSRSFTGSPFRDFSPPRRGRGPSRYRSPIRSPPRRRGAPPDHYRPERHHHHHRAYSRERDHSRRPPPPPIDDRDRDYQPNYYEYDERHHRSTKRPDWNPPPPSRSGPLPPPPTQADFYHHAHHHHQQQPPPPMHHGDAFNRYAPPPRDYGHFKPEAVAMHHSMAAAAARRYDDIAPPGVEEPPVPGMEGSPPPQISYAPPPQQQQQQQQQLEQVELMNEQSMVKGESPKRGGESPGHMRERGAGTPERVHSRKRRESREREEVDKTSSKKEKKRKKDKKESSKKRKDKKEKHHRKDDRKEDKKREVDVEKPHDKKEKDKDKKEKEKIDQPPPPPPIQKEPTPEPDLEPEPINEPQYEQQTQLEQSPEKFDDLPENVLEIHANDLKSELDDSTLNLLPEKSKWEEDEQDGSTSPKESHKSSNSTKIVTSEVLKRAENAIFKRAINAIRPPIEIKKISTDRAKLYVDEGSAVVAEDETESGEIREAEAAAEAAPAAPRLSVKERLGVKVDDASERVVRVERHASRSLSPFSRRERNYNQERRVEVVRRRGGGGSPARRRRGSREFGRKSAERRRAAEYKARHARKTEEKGRERGKSGGRRNEERAKAKRGRSDEGEERRVKRRGERKGGRRDSKTKVEEVKQEVGKSNEERERYVKEGSKEVGKVKVSEVQKQKKPTIDEASFEPDYDLESEEDKEKKEKSSSGSDSSDSSSGDDKKKKHGRKHRKKRSRKDSSSSSSDSETESSEDDGKERKRKKHKKKQKKRKKSKHK